VTLSVKTSQTQRKHSGGRLLLLALSGLPVSLLAGLATGLTGCQSTFPVARDSQAPTSTRMAAAHIALTAPEVETTAGDSATGGSVVLLSGSESVPRGRDEGEGADGLARVPRPFPANDAARAMPSGLFPGASPLPAQAMYAPVPTGAVQPVVHFSAAEERLDLGDGLESPLSGSQAQRYPDEYLLDGGDRGQPVHYGLAERRGLETEDTVAEYSDHTGNRHTLPSNTVAIYAPRFAAIRSVTTPTGDVNIERLSGLQDVRHDSGMKFRTGPQRYARSERARGVRMRSRVSGVDNFDRQSGVEQVARLDSHTKLLNLYEEFSYLYQSQIHQADEAHLAAGIDAALHWTRTDSPVLMAQLDSAHQVHAKFRAAEMVGTEDEAPDPGRLKITKLADRATAEPGDVVTFVIRYENVGDRELYGIRIVDNLTPRLEYIEDSATSDRAGEIVVQDNDEGSVVLTFQMDDALPGHKEKDSAKNRDKDIRTFGVITFQCRIR